MSQEAITINRAPVLTLWASVVAERLGFDREEALSLGKAVAGLTAQSKGRRLGVFKPARGKDGRPHRKTNLGEEFWVELCGRAVPAKRVSGSVRAVVKDRPIEPDKVTQYLEQKFGEDLDRVRRTLVTLAAAFDPDDLPDKAFGLYEQFRPSVPSGTRGWGAKGALDLGLIRSLSRKRR